MNHTVPDTKEEIIVQKPVFGSIITDDVQDTTIANAIQWLTEQLDMVPEEYKKTAFISIDSIWGWDEEHHAEIKLYYTRPETINEMRNRMMEYRKHVQKELEKYEACALAARRTLEKLPPE